MADDSTDWIPPAPPTPYWHEDVSTPYGVIPRWKATALAIGEVQAVYREMRQDAASEVTPVRDEDKPPPVVAEEEKEAAAQLDAAWLKKVEEAVERLDQRIAMFEMRKKAEDALKQLEDEMEQANPAPDDTLH